MSEPSQKQIRATVLAAVLNRWPHDDPASLPTALARYAIVQRYGGGSASYWVDLYDEPQEGIDELSASYSETGFEPFVIVDLDSGHSRFVDVRFVLGDESDHALHDFTGAFPSSPTPPTP